MKDLTQPVLLRKPVQQYIAKRIGKRRADGFTVRLKRVRLQLGRKRKKEVTVVVSSIPHRPELVVVGKIETLLRCNGKWC